MSDTVNLPLTLAEGWVAVLVASGADKTGLISTKGNIEIAFGTTLPNADGHPINQDRYNYSIPDGETMYAKSTRRKSIIVYTED